jgi:hypothetical protein
VVVSKALRKVDQETRREIRDKRLLALEADNYAVELSVEAEEDYSEEVRRILFPLTSDPGRESNSEEEGEAKSGRGQVRFCYHSLD